MTSIPLVDEESPFYCSKAVFVSSSDSTDCSDANLSLSAFLRKLTGQPGHDQGHRKTETMGSANTIEQTVVHGQKRVLPNEVAETPPVRSGLAGPASSPCGQFPSSLEGSGPARKRARYADSAKETSSLEMTDSEWNRICEDMWQKQPVRARSQEVQDDRTREVFELDRDQQSQASAEGNIEGRVSTRTLLLRLDEILPGHAFRECAESDVFAGETPQDLPTNHQDIVNLLAGPGVINEKVLTAFRGTEIRKLDLGPTMCSTNRFTFPRGNVMHVLSKSGWFKHLNTLSFAGGRFQDDFDLVYIQPLRQLEKLILANTGIGNEGVFHIVGLKHNLQHLDLSGNPLIDDDVIPALIILENLRYLSIIGAGILMPGLRKLATAMKEGERVFEVQIPIVCRKHMDGRLINDVSPRHCHSDNESGAPKSEDIHKHYLLQPAPPLISDPSVCPMLSKIALSSNLSAHAVINPTIVSTGTRKELEERLTRLLEMRKLDLVVRDVLCREIAKD